MLNIVVSCTYRKRRVGVASKLDPAYQVRLGAQDGMIDVRAAGWWEQLEEEDLPTLPAEKLYAGEHWSTSLSLAEAARRQGEKVALWVCSAGYGLVPVDAPLKPYSATFSPGPDSVHRPERDSLSPSEANERWWSLLSGYAFGSHPRSIGELHDANRENRLIIVASERYLRALRGDLLSATRLDPERALFVSSGYPSNDGLSEFLLPADARLQPRVGGVRQALNARLALWAVEERSEGEGFDSVRRRFARRLARAPELQKFDRTPMTDESVRRFLREGIREQLRKGARPAHSPLLRALRDDGHACEQKRFRRLFHEVKEQINA